MINLYIFNTSRKLALIVLMTVFCVVGCTKKEDSSQMKIAMPDWKALAQSHQAASSTAGTVNVVSRVMINISGPDIPTQVRIWSLNDLGYKTGDPIPTPPPSYTFDVKRGSDRLFQVLAIAQEFDTSAAGEGDGPMNFFYGDVTKSLARDFEDIPIQLTSQGVVGADMGNISGRYLDASGAGPTARLNMFYAPPGRPEMIVDTGTMFSGFFDIGLPAVAQFSYRLASGQTLFDRFTINSLDGALGPQLMRLEVPAGFNQRDSTRTPRSARTRVIGFVGPGAAAKKMCYSPAIEPLQNLYTSSSVANPAKVIWNPANGSAADARVIGGGTFTTDPACVAANELGGDHFKLITQTLAYGDSPVGIRGPFSEIAPSTNNFLSGSHSGTNLTLSWKFLKPVIGNSVDGVGIFTKTLAAGEVANKRWQESAPCSMLASNHGFTEITRVAAGTVAAPVETYVVPDVAVASFAAGNHVTLLCPYSNTKGYYDFALMFNGSNGQQAMPVATKLVARRIAHPLESTSTTRTAVANSACTPILVRMTDAAGNDGYRPGASGPIQVQATLVGSPTDAYLYDYADCGPGFGSTKIYNNNGKNEFTVWVKTDATNAQFDLQITDVTAGGTSVAPTTFYGVLSPNVAPDTLLSVASPIAPAHQCLPVYLLQGKTVAGDFVPQGSSGFVDLSSTLSSYPGLGFYNAGDCVDPISSRGFTSYQTTSAVWMKYTGAASSIIFAPTTGLTAPTATIAIQQPGPPTMLRIEISPNFGAETCQMVRVRSHDSMGRTSPTAAMGVVTFTYDGSTSRPVNGGAYSNAACSTQIADVTVGSGNTESAPFYMRFAVQGPVAVSGTSTNAQSVPVSNVGVGSAPLAAIIARIPEVTWSFAMGYLGYGPQRSEGASASPFSVVLEARTPMGNLISGFAESNMNDINLSNQYETATCASLSAWAGGSATLSGCYFSGGVAAGYASVLRTGGGGTPYPFHSTAEQFFVTAPGEGGAGFTHFFSRATSYYGGTCQPLMVQRRYNTSLSLPVTTPFSASLVPGPNVAGFYSDSICTAGIGTADIPAGKSETIIYMMPTGAGVPNPTAGGASLVDPDNYSATSFVMTAGPYAPSIYKLNAHRTTSEAACEPVMAVRTDLEGTASPTGSVLTLTLTQSAMGATFHATANCGTAPISTVLMLPGQSAVLFYYRPMIPSSTGTITVTDDAGTPLTGSLSPITVNSNGGI